MPRGRSAKSNNLVEEKALPTRKNPSRQKRVAAEVSEAVPEDEPVIKKRRGKAVKKEPEIKEEVIEDEVIDPQPSTSNGSTSRRKGKKAIKEEIEEDVDEEAEDKKSGTKKQKKEKPPPKQAVERKLVKKGNCAVDSSCPIAEKCHVLEEDGIVWDCMLNQTNIQFNNNKYYLIQLLEDDKGGVYSVWMRWGRVGAPGQNSLKQCGASLTQAKNVFTKKFSDKTKNDWEDKDNFEKVQGKYDLVHMDYTEDSEEEVKPKDEVDSKKEKKELVCKLEDRVKTLVELICDIRVMEEAVKEMKYDAKKAPLGKLTKAQIKAGYSALLVISNLLSPASGKKDTRGLLQASNDFYTRIPHYFGMKVPPLIDTPQHVKEKIELLEALGDIQAAMSFIKDSKLDTNVHPADSHYVGLKCDISALDSTSDNYKLISKYVSLNHGYTHSDYKLKVQNIFEVTKEGEDERFKSDIGNRMLLWHGSRLSNWAGILSQGLRIAPPEAPVTGYMFGKGVYFADMCSKSANYCMANCSNSTGLMVLCEVALGKSNELVNAKYDGDKLPKGCHSVKGVGSVVPDEKNFVTMDDGVIVPLGPAKNTKKSSSLIYNEFIVYDVAQVKLKYLVKVDFEFTSSWY